MKRFDIIRLDKIDSTNEYCKSLVSKGETGKIVVSLEQTKGKGRFDREWYSLKGGLYMSILLKVEDLNKAKYLTFCAALSVLHSLDVKTKIKWPNDLYYYDMKLAGILTETIISKNNDVIIGIGLNLNQDSMPQEIAEFATSLKIETGKEQDTEKIFQRIVKYFERFLGMYENDNLDEILEEVKENSFMMNKKVQINTLNGKVTGRVIDIDKECNLVIKTEKGEVRIISEGDLDV